MEIFSATLNQMGYLFSLIVLGFILAKIRVIPENSAAVLAKLENNLFIPALVLGNFMMNFTVDNMSSYAWAVGTSSVILVLTVPVAILLSKLCAKDRYIRGLYTYGLSFSNFGFMGNAVVMAIFPDVFTEYLIYCIPLWTMIYVWGVPSLLIPDDSGHKHTLADKLKNFVNPMFVCLVIGMVLGICGIGKHIPENSFVISTVDVLGDCMSPVAMLLTGITVAKMDFKKTFADKGIYISSFFRLVLFPAVFAVVFVLLKKTALIIPDTVTVCAMCALAMPLGLNTIVIPSAYGKDTSVSTGMAIVSHIASCVTIPAVFMLIQNVIL